MKKIIAKINKQIKEERFLKSEGVDVSNILDTSTRRGAAASAADAGKPAPLARMTKRGKNKLLEALK
jgi:hypothetical protein